MKSLYRFEVCHDQSLKTPPEESTQGEDGGHGGVTFRPIIPVRWNLPGASGDGVALRIDCNVVSHVYLLKLARSIAADHWPCFTALLCVCILRGYDGKLGSLGLHWDHLRPGLPDVMVGGGTLRAAVTR